MDVVPISRNHYFVRFYLRRKKQWAGASFYYSTFISILSRELKQCGNDHHHHHRRVDSRMDGWTDGWTDVDW